MNGYIGNIEHITEANNDFRKVIYTAHHMQLVVMTLQAGENIGEEIHPNIDQFFRVESGVGVVKINGNIQHIKAGDAIIIPAKSKHDILNYGKTPLKMYTIYTPPHHKDHVDFKTKADAIKSKESFDGKTTE